MSAFHQDDLKAFQLFHAGGHAPWEPLAVLRRLWNIDKHRVLYAGVVRN